MKKIFSPNPFWQEGGLFLVRLTVGLFMIYHGWEVFDDAKMKEYAGWEAFSNSSVPGLWAYTGKTAELLAGVLLAVGFLTRIAASILIITLTYISFFIGHGKIWYEDQYPFLFVLLGLVFFFSGGGRYSVDALIFTNKTDT